MAGTVGFESTTAGGGEEPVEEDAPTVEEATSDGLLADLSLTDRPLGGTSFFETNPVRVAGEDADPTASGTADGAGGSDVSTTSTERFDQPVDATDVSLSDPFNVDLPDVDTGPLLPDLSAEQKAALALVVLVVLGVVFRPYASGAATVAERVPGG